ncbi:MAG: DUF411 domain-containing protein [Betaproteobacteria bacterium]
MTPNLPSLLYALLLVALLQGPAAAAADLPTVTVYKSATCGCCTRWAEHMRQQGFTVTTHDVADVGAERRRLGMWDGFSACHTAVVGGYVVEGHVPASDIKRLLAEKPKALGLAVPNMPNGSPGMESPRPVPYDVLLVQNNGSVRTFAQH